MCASKVDQFMKQYLPNRLNKWGFKLFVLFSLSGYAYNFEIFTHKQGFTEAPGVVASNCAGKLF